MKSNSWARFIRRVTVLVLVSTSSAGVLGAELNQYSPPPAGSVRITRDRFGVPHIVASDDHSLFYGVGYAQAEDQAENVAKNFLRGQGRIAEVDGPGELITDHLVRMMQIPEQAHRQFTQMGSTSRGHLEGYVQGFNAYVDAHKDQLPKWIKPASAEEVLAFFLYTELLFTVSHCRDDLAKANVKIPVTGNDPRLRSSQRTWIDLSRVAMAAHDEADTYGSNQFAISPQRSTTGKAILSMDPHLPLFGFYRWYEMHLVGPNMNTMGCCFFGSPYVTMGRTQNCAWCMTVNAPDLGDVYGFKINPDNPKQYRDLDGWKDFDDSVEVYQVREGDKSIERKLPSRRTSLGPVVAEKDGVAYVFALPWSETSNRIEQILTMARANSVAEFKKSLESLGLIMFNLVYTDVHGDIYYISNARLPKRDTRISSHDVRPGEESWARWQGFHKIDELPQVLNPPCGYVLNTNSGPQNVCPEVAPKLENYPPYMMGQTANARSKRLSALLAADEQISPDEAQAYASDNYLIAADEWAPRLIKLLDSIDTSHPQREAAQQAARILEKWDRRTNVDSRGAALCVRLAANTPLLSADSDPDKPSPELVASIVKELEAIKNDLGALDAPWGDFSRIRRGELELAIAGCGFREPRLSPFIALRPTYGLVNQGKRYAVVGSSYGMIIDFSNGVSAVSCLPFGVSDNPSSPHFADHLPLYAQGKFKPAWFEPADIEANRGSEFVLQLPK